MLHVVTFTSCHVPPTEAIVQGYSKWLSWFQQLVIHNTLEIAVCSCTDGSRNFHFQRHVREFLNQHLPQRWIGWCATDSLERTGLSCWCLYNHKRCTYRAPVRYVTSAVLLNKKYIYCCLKSIVYGKLLKSRQSFRITLYIILTLLTKTLKVLTRVSRVELGYTTGTCC
jgi:hypothetical protein